MSPVRVLLLVSAIRGRFLLFFLLVLLGIFLPFAFFFLRVVFPAFLFLRVVLPAFLFLLQRECALIRVNFSAVSYRRRVQGISLLRIVRDRHSRIQSVGFVAEQAGKRRGAGPVVQVPFQDRLLPGTVVRRMGISGRERDGLLCIDVSRILIIAVGNAAVHEGVRSVVIVLRADHEELVGIAHGPVIAVCQVHRVDRAVPELYHVPHVLYTRCAGPEISCHGHAGDLPVPGCQVAEVLETFGKSLADHLGLRVPVKNIDQLIRVSVSAVIAGRLIIVRSELEDRVSVSRKLPPVRKLRRLRDDFLRFVHRALRGPGPLCVHKAQLLGLCLLARLL